jgi:hypothetical protein
MYYQTSNPGTGCACAGLGQTEKSGPLTTWITGGLLVALAIGVAVVDKKGLIPLAKTSS